MSISHGGTRVWTLLVAVVGVLAATAGLTNDSLQIWDRFNKKEKEQPTTPASSPPKGPTAGEHDGTKADNGTRTSVSQDHHISKKKHAAPVELEAIIGSYSRVPSDSYGGSTLDIMSDGPGRLRWQIQEYSVPMGVPGNTKLRGEAGEAKIVGRKAISVTKDGQYQHTFSFSEDGNTIEKQISAAADGTAYSPARFEKTSPFIDSWAYFNDSRGDEAFLVVPN